jgi:UDP-2,3-diacylglucosamine pyrophosphatase LpxH
VSTSTVIISDVHLGAPNSRTGALLDFLDWLPNQLIINGDLVDSLDLRLFREADWKVIDKLRKLVDERRLTFISGNHDRGDGGGDFVLPTILGIKHHDYEMWLKTAGKHYLITHGDRFDRTLNWRRINWIADSIYYYIQKLGTSGSALKHAAKIISGAASGVKKTAVDYAKSLGYAGIIVGHTHIYGSEICDGVEYLNSGCWTESTCSYIETDGETIEVKHWG